MSILVVDDNSLLLSKIVHSLVRNQQVVHSATTLAVARKLIATQHPEVLCIDLHLPDGNGFDLIEELRDKGDNLPVVVISGHYEEETRVRAERLGVSGFLAKPFSLQALNQMLDMILSGGANLHGGKSCQPAAETREPVLKPLQPGRIQAAKRSFTTRRVDLEQARHLIVDNYAPCAGDLVLARVDRPRQHCRIELPNGRRAWMIYGDDIVVSYGHRYAPDQFEAEVPEDLGPCHLVAAGGLAARALSRHASIKNATEITPYGVLADAEGKPLNLKDFGLAPRKIESALPPVIAVLGSSMNAGKTTVAADLAIGLRRAGLRVGSVKVTGSGAGGDCWRLLDAGASPVLDFTDAGYASTYKLSPDVCESILETLLAEVTDVGVDAVLIEVADGILQPETRALAQSDRFRRLVDNVVFAAGDALGAINGAKWLQENGVMVAALAGIVTASPLAVRECQHVIDLPVVGRGQLRQAQWLPPCVGVPETDAAHCLPA